MLGVRSIPIKAIPGLADAGWRQPTKAQCPEHVVEESSDLDKLAKTLNTILAVVRQNGNSWPFLKPVDKNEVPDYYEHIKYPMDLKTMGDRVKKG